MLKLGLLTMPETLLAFPSIGLAEISSVLKKKFEKQIHVDTLYPCLDYAKFIGVDNYLEFQAAGLNKWMFYKEAFPNAEDYTESLKQQIFLQGKNVTKERVWKKFIEKRQEIDIYINTIIDKYDMLQYDVLGISSAFSQNIASFALAKQIKVKKPDCIVVMGGANCEYPMGKEIVTHIAEVDFVFSGLGIISFSHFIECLLNKDSENIHRINGVFSKKNQVCDKKIESKDTNEYQVTALGDLHDINMCIELDYDSFLLDYKKFCDETGYAHKPVLLFETSRGCWKKDGLPCTFCGLNLPNVCYESMKPEIAREYIQNMITKYAGECNILSCVDNILDKRYIKEVLPFLKVPEDMSIVYEVNSALSKEEMKVCADAGVTIVQPGVESLNTQELKLMQKGITAFTNITFLKRCIETGIYPIWNYLYRVPGNTDESNYAGIADVIPLLRHLPPPTSTAPIGFHKFSPFTENAKKYDLQLVPDPGFSRVYPFDEETIQKVAFFFLDAKEDAAYKIIAEKYIPDISMEILEWVAAFKVQEEIPKLYYMDDYHIFDSRFDVDNPDIYALTPLEWKVIKYLERPMTFEQLIFLLKNETADDIFEAVDSLNAMQLLFNEKDRYLSLVCEKCNWSKGCFDRRTELLELTSTKILS